MTDEGHDGLPAESVITAMAETWSEMTGIAEKLKSIPSNLPTDEMRQRHDALVLRHTKLSYEEGIAAGWQAARDHYAPKLTEKEAVASAVSALDMLDDEGTPFAHRRWAEEVFRAAGVRFKEEA
jgi:hypothetical protein